MKRDGGVFQVVEQVRP